MLHEDGRLEYTVCVKIRSQYRSGLYFDAVRRYGSIREAARRLNVAASAINRQILNLENEIGLPLFERFPHGMTLTPAGEMVARHTIAVLQDEKRLADELDALIGLRRGEISLFAAESLTTEFLPNVIGQMSKRYPGIKIRLRIEGSNDIPELLLRGESDFGLAFSLPLDRRLCRLAEGKLALGALVKREHPLVAEAAAAGLSFSQCTKYPLILPTADLSIFTLLESQLRQYENRMHVVAEANSVALIRYLAVHLGGVAFQTRTGIEPELAAGTLVFLPLTRPRAVVTELGVYMRQGRTLSFVLDIFLSILQREIKNYVAADRNKKPVKRRK